VLWRDGNHAVVSLKLANGTWCRAVSCDCRDLFNVELDSSTLARLVDQVHRATRAQSLRERGRKAKLAREASEARQTATIGAGPASLYQGGLKPTRRESTT
jgi:hypothetical protein